ncbi:hypothetical protein UlMin_035903 [Ulmus minor]
MDLPQFHHQNQHHQQYHHLQNQNQNRYVSVPNPNPSRPHYTDDPNFREPRPSDHPRYQHHYQHHVLQVPAPQAPPPPTPPLQSLPPPPPLPPHSSPYRPLPIHQFNPSPSQFAFSTSNHDHPFEDDPLRHSHPVRESVVPVKVSRRSPVEDGHFRRRLPEFEHSYLEAREFRDLPIGLTDNRAERSYPHVGFERDSHKLQFDRKSMSPYKIRHDSEGSSRFRGEYVDGFQSNHREELIRVPEDENFSRRGHFVVNSDVSFHDSGFVSNTLSRDLELKSESYNGRYANAYDNEVFRANRRDGVSDNQRRGHDRKAPRDSYGSSFEREGIESGNGDGARMFSGKRDYYGSEGRYNSKGIGRESSHEYNRTPRKQLQKKSAFLRIQKPNYRNAEGEKVHYSGHYDSNSNSFKRKDQHVYFGHGMEGSPVELDVSFKSNSLVAKAVVVPPSSSDIIDGDLTPSNLKVTKESLSGRDCSNSDLTKVCDNTINSDSSMHVANHASTNDKGMMSSEGKDASCIEKNSSSHACSSATNHSIGNSEVGRSIKGADLDKDVTKRVSDKPSRKVAKKKKVVKKTVKKVVRPRSQTLNAQQMKKRTEPSKGKGAASLSSVCPNEENRLHPKTQAEGSPVAIESKEQKIDANSNMNCVPNTEKSANSSSNHVGSFGRDEIKIGDGSENTDCSSQGFHAMSNSNKDLVKSPSVSALADIEGVVDVKQSDQSRDSLLLENGLGKDSTLAMFPDVGNGDSALTNSGKTKMHGDFMTINSSSSTTDTTLDIVDGLKLSKEEFTVSDVGNIDTSIKQASGVLFTTLQDNCFPEDSSKANSSAVSIATVGLSCSGETTIDTNSKNQLRDTPEVSENVENYDKNPIASNRGTIDCVAKLSSMDAPAELPESSVTERSPTADISGGDIQGIPIIKKHRTVGSQSDLSGITDIDVNRIDGSNPATAIQRKRNFSFEDPNCEEVAVSCVGSLEVGLQSGKEGGEVLRGDVFSEAEFLAGSDINSSLCDSTLQSGKRRRVSHQHAMPSLNTSQIDEQPAETSISFVEVPLTSKDDLTQQNNELDTYISIGDAANLIHSENKLLEGSLNAVDAVRSSFNDGNVNFGDQFGSCSTLDESIFPTVEFLRSSGSGKENYDTAVTAISSQKIDVSNIDNCGEEMPGTFSSKEHVVTNCETAQSIIPSEFQPDIDPKCPCTGIESDSLLVTGDSPQISNYLSLSADDNGVSTTNSSDEVMESTPDTLKNMGSPQTLFDVSTTIHMLDVTSASQTYNETSRDEKRLDEGSSDFSPNPFSEVTKISLKSDSLSESDLSIAGMTSLLPLENTRSTSHGLNSTSVGCSAQKKQLGRSIPRTFSGGHLSSGSTSLKKTASSIHANRRTWHRSGTSAAAPLPGSKPYSRTAVPSQRQLVERDGKFQSTSYIRKGNKLVRKPSPAAAKPQGSIGFSPTVYRSSTVGVDELKRGNGSDSRVGVGNSPGFLRMGETKSSCDKPRIPEIPSGTISTNCTATSSGDCISSPSSGPLLDGCSDATSDLMKSPENNDALKLADNSLTSEPLDQNDELNSLENPTELNEGNLTSLNMKGIVYVKRKSNQLVATSNSRDFSVSNADKIPTSSFDGYYKRRKNQLIRTSLEKLTKQLATTPDDNLNSKVQMVPKTISSRRLSMRLSLKVNAKARKHSKNSLVWTLCSAQMSKHNSGSLDHHKVFPHLFPWKRTTYWRSFMQNWTLVSKSSSSTISRKLLLSRKQDAVYTRSIDGFSLRKSKVLSVGGSSLKWSKSIERQSKKANEEATLAVAAVERKKREQNGATCIASGSENKHHSSRERIFRIGLFRYKMDPSKRTLQRISDDEHSCTATSHSDKNAKTIYIPRRLVIGNDEYVRIGNGNQLIRDPKKRVRVLASEKVRWSLHTARLRLAKKRKYCQFFTRFGKCNKGDGKCPYVHDPSKIAVCTKFLKGLCSNANCKLTHEVIPERMPDCSYFLQGLCNNQNCPYRHVNVNPKAPSCEGFLRGYCVDGNECRKKHSYACPSFEATGTCPQGSKCKLHHPKTRTCGKKRKRSRELKNARGRYFGSTDVSVSETRTTVSEKPFAQDSNDMFLEENCGDFIALNVSEDRDGESNDPMSIYESDTSEFQIEDTDDLIKPFRLMGNGCNSSVKITC